MKLIIIQIFNAIYFLCVCLFAKDHVPMRHTAISNETQNISYYFPIFLLLLLLRGEWENHRKTKKLMSLCSHFSSATLMPASSVYLFSFVSCARAKYKTVFCVVRYCVCVHAVVLLHVCFHSFRCDSSFLSYFLTSISVRNDRRLYKSLHITSLRMHTRTAQHFASTLSGKYHLSHSAFCDDILRNRIIRK